MAVVKTRTRQQVGKLFADRRFVERDLSQQEAADLAGIGIASVQNVESGKQSVSDRTYAKYALGLGWPKDAHIRLLEGADPAELPTVDHDKNGAEQASTEATLASLVDEVRLLRQALDRATREGIRLNDPPPPD